MKNPNSSYTPYGVSKAAMSKRWGNIEPITECPYCGGEVSAVNNYVIYHGYNYGKYPWIYYCPDCKANIGIYDDTNIPKGTLADKETKEARTDVFDHLKITGRTLNTEDKSVVYDELLKVCDIDLSQTWVNTLSAEKCLIVICGCSEIVHGIQMAKQMKEFEKTPQYLEDKKKWENENPSQQHIN